MTTGAQRLGRHRERGQSTVELALLLPVVVMVLLAVVQFGLIARDRVLTVHAARAVARAVAVQPDMAAARTALHEAVPGPARFRVALGGELRSGGLATVTVSAAATRIPLVGAVLPGVVLQERLVVRVEGG